MFAVLGKVCLDTSSTSSTQCVKGGGPEKFLFLRKLLHWAGQSDGAGWCSTFRTSTFTCFGTKNGPFMAINAFFGHWRLRRPQMASTS